MQHALPAHVHGHTARTLTRRLGWLALGLAAWLAHIGLDRGLGFGLRTPAGFQRG